MKETGVGTRVLNFLVDNMFLLLLSYIAFRIWKWYVFYYGYPYYHFGWFYGGTLVLYYTFFEAVYGRTPGKWISFTRVVNSQNRKPGFLTILWRSLLRLTIIDFLFIPFYNRPLHDVLSRTRLVEA